MCASQNPKILFLKPVKLNILCVPTLGHMCVTLKEICNTECWRILHLHPMFK